MKQIKKMGLLTVAGISFLATSQAFALNVGDDASCVVLEQQQVNGEATEGCIRDQLSPETQEFTLLDFSSIYCSTCEANLPKLSQLALDIEATTTTRKVTIDRSKEAVKEYLADKGDLITFPVAFDTERDAKAAYHVVSTPTLYILNKQNKVIYKHRGLLRDSDIREIKELVGVCNQSNH